MTPPSGIPPKPRPRRWRRARQALYGLLALVLLSALGGWLWLRRSLPAFNGVVSVSGARAEIEIVRDAHAIPHIIAHSEADAYMGLGYAHAQDRLWQLELNRRLGTGTLAEIFGSRALGRDRLFRTLGLKQAAAHSLTHLSAQSRQALESYAAGINAWLEESLPLPPEFALLGVEPQPWLPVDSIVLLKVMAWTLSGNLHRELERWQLSQLLSPQQLAEFLAPYPGDKATLLSNLPLVYGALGKPAPTGAWRAPEGDPFDELQFNGPPPDGLGSNNWVVSGDRSASGKPLLANDPHLALTSPSIWYLAHLKGPDLSVIGATLPGVPGVILGRNESVAWAFTNTGSDVQDLYLERLAPEQPDFYDTPSGARRFETRTETLRTSDGEDELLTVRSSRHGPILSDVQRRAARLLPDGYVLSLRWSALEPDDRSFDFITAAAHAQTAAELRHAARNFHSPTQNVVYADNQGHIGFLAAGRVPIRHQDNYLRGLLPAPGWDARYDWQGYLAFEQLPQRTNPALDRIVTANQKITEADYPHWLTSEWSDPTRAQRIETLLDAIPQHSVQSFQRMQLDVKGGMAERLLPLLLESVKGEDWTELEAHVLGRLANWNREMRADLPEPLAFASWLRELAPLVYADELGAAFENAWDARPRFLSNVLAADGAQSRWCDDVTTPKTRESCASRVALAFRTAVTALQNQHGANFDHWRWGEVHRARSRHFPFSDVPLLRNWFDTTTESPGDSQTVNAGAYAVGRTNGPFANRHAAGLRAVYDLGDPERSVFLLRTGQSGHPLSPHFRNWNDRWSQGDSVPMVTRKNHYAVGALGTVRLVPRVTEEPLAHP